MSTPLPSTVHRRSRVHIDAIPTCGIRNIDIYRSIYNYSTLNLWFESSGSRVQALFIIGKGVARVRVADWVVVDEDKAKHAREYMEGLVYFFHAAGDEDGTVRA